MIRQCKTISLFAAFLWLVSSTNSLAFAQEKKTFVAYSMRVAQARVEQAIKQGIDWRKKEPDLFYLGGVTKPLAVVLDAKTNDWILVGERDPKSSVLTLDDWVVALRARFIHGEKDPGVTIDPVCPKGSIREGCGDFTRQEVRFFGGIENTHFGQVCYEADWLMKRIGLAVEKLPIEKLKTYYELLLEQHRNVSGARTSVSSRFWFFPIVNRVNVLGDVVLLEKLQMGVFTEMLYAEVDGKPIANVDKFEYYPSDGFSRSFSENYDAAAEAREVLETLRGLTRLAALAKGLTQIDQKPNVDFYLKNYPMERAETPKEKEVLRVENRKVGFRVSGGVNLMALAMRLKGGEVGALKELVLKTRTSERQLNWGFEMRMEDGRLKEVSLPPGTTDPSQITPLFVQAVFLQQKKRYDAAIEGYRKVLQLDRNDSEAYNNRGSIYDVKGQYDQAISDFNKALEINPMFVGAYNNRGVSHRNKGNYDAAIADFTKAIELNPKFAEAYVNRGAALAEYREDSAQAITDYTKAIELNPKFAEAYVNRGNARSLRGDYEGAIKDYNLALEINPFLAEAYVKRGIIHGIKGDQRRALEDNDRALAINPELGIAWFVKGTYHEAQKNYQDAFLCYEKATTLSPTDAASWYNKGVTLIYLDRPKESLTCFQKFIELATAPRHSRLIPEARNIIKILEVEVKRRGQ